ncbi:hypothetical protein SO802_003625 [Lithocarpus litseifolius]|uniref:Large ribosomal subunit protein uL11 C-terminal domain-containing protein n=1 Tax=Lithocarpus litseifolius TaxID=425828 RepID=A0AAW2E1J4_9ROSI
MWVPIAQIRDFDQEGLLLKKIGEDIVKNIGEDIVKETAKDWKGLCMTMKLTVQNCQAKVLVVPSVAALVIKALKELERDRKKMNNIKHNGNISLDNIIEIA